MTSQELTNVKTLSTWSFNIPFYQRGYRWKREQVRQLLDDLNGFRPTASAPFYFFQALVIAEHNREAKREFNVVDGQQRLTTLNLLLNALVQTPQSTSQPTKLSLTYARSPDGHTALGALDTYYCELAEKVIKGWIESNPSSIESIREKVLAGKFLVYKVNQKDELETFSRLNSGKIRAKDSELIKSIMLTPQLDEPLVVTQSRAQEWDAIERALNHDPFFSFFTAKGTWKEDDRMAVLLNWADLVPEKEEKQNEVFPYLACVQKKLQAGTSRADIWNGIYTTYYRLAAWYDDPLMYHAIGWLVHRRKGGETPLWVDDPRASKEPDWLTHQRCRTDPVQLKTRLCKEIKTMCAEPIWESDDLFATYPVLAHNYLLLFNVTYCWQRWPLRYDFCRHRQIERWTLEHIFARNQSDFGNKADLQKYLGGVELNEDAFLEYQAACKEGKGADWLQKWLEKNRFDEDYPEEEDHSLGNLALLGQAENSSLSNRLFMAKREEIANWPQAKTYWAPPATEAVFLKSFPGLEVAKQYWTKDDRGKYVAYMKDIVENFAAAIDAQLGTPVRSHHE